MAKVMVAIPDPHYAPDDSKDGGVDPIAEKVALKVTLAVKPDIAYFLGDIGEFHSISHWHYKKVKRPPLEYQMLGADLEVKAANDGLNKWDKVLDKVGCNRRIVTLGNHDNWLNDWVDAYPMIPQYRPHNAMHFKERGYEWYPYGEYIHFGKLSAYHGGHWMGLNHTRAHAQNLGRNVIYGHVHDVQVSKVQHLGGQVGAWSLGCLCKLKKAFLQGRPTNWSHAITVITLEDNGNFHVNVVDIVEGVAYVWGSRVKA